MNDNNRIIFNTTVVYGQLVVSMLIGLLSVRFILQALGEDDYGTYSVVAGIISTLNVFTTCISGASMRFMSHSLGSKDMELSKTTFNTSLKIHILFGFLLLLALEVGGWLMFEYFINIPESRLESAKIVYQFMIITAYVTIVSVPFDAIINAHENLLFLSVVTIGGQVLSLFSALYLLYIYEGDKLLLYGFLMLLIAIIQRITKQVYCHRKYEECTISLSRYKDNTLFKRMLSFIGWDFLSNAIGSLSSHLNTLLINNYFGVKLNAGQGVAGQVNKHVNQLSTAITRAITPQMNKSEGSGDRTRLIKLTEVGVKYTTFIFALFAIPIMLELPFLLKLWLGKIPSYAVIFCMMIMITQIISKLTWQIGNAVRAVGDIKGITIGGSIINLSTILLSFLVLYFGGKPESIYYVGIFMALIKGGLFLYFGEKEVGIDPKQYIKETIVPFVIPLAISLAVAFPLQLLMNESFFRFVLVVSSFVLTFSFLFIRFRMSESERVTLKNYIKSFLHK